MVGLWFGPYWAAFNEFFKFYLVAADKYRSNSRIRLLLPVPTAFHLVIDSSPSCVAIYSLNY
jgi:hypothetical protein